MKQLFIIIIILSTISVIGQNSNHFSIKDGKVSFNLPHNWKLNHSVLYDDNDQKIGEIVQGLTEGLSGNEFIQTYKNGFIDDMPTTKFVKSDIFVLNEVKWFYALRKSEWEDAKGNTGFWYCHNFMRQCPTNSFQLVLYNYTGDLEQWMKQILKEINCK